MVTSRAGLRVHAREVVRHLEIVVVALELGLNTSAPDPFVVGLPLDNFRAALDCARLGLAQLEREETRR